jgi:hypothetical protein
VDALSAEDQQKVQELRTKRNEAWNVQAVSTNTAIPQVSSVQPPAPEAPVPPNPQFNVGATMSQRNVTFAPSHTL